jgi:anti-sigma factor RsiW
LTCLEVAPLIDAFIDAELPRPTLLEVARHAGGCAACDRTLRELGELCEAVGRTERADAEALDVPDLWPGVARQVARQEVRRLWRRRLRAAPAWGMAAAAAAAVLLWVRGAPEEPARVAARPRPNQAVIERLDGTARVELRHERKNGTTLIMVSDTGGALR